MEYMKEVVFTAIVCGLFATLSTIGRGSSGKYVKYAASLAFLYIIVSPLVNNAVNSIGMIEKIKSIGEITDNSDNVINEPEVSLEILTNEICKAAVVSAAEEFSVPEEDFSIKLILDITKTNEISIKTAEVHVSGSAIKLDSNIIKKYFSKILNCSVEVVEDE